MQETQVQSLDWEDPWEKEMATHPRILMWEIPWTEGAQQATVHGVPEEWTQLGLDSNNVLFRVHSCCNMCQNIFPV